MLHRGSSDFFELLGEGGWPNDSREQQIQDFVDAGEANLQNAHDAYDIRHTGERMSLHMFLSPVDNCCRVECVVLEIEKKKEEETKTEIPKIRRRFLSGSGS